MATPILATKLYRPPPQPTLLRRPRLLTLLNEGMRGKLTLISAPAGFGKTTLASSWVNEFRANHNSSLGTRTAWLSLDEGESDPFRFVAYLIAALLRRAVARRIRPDFARRLLAAFPTTAGEDGAAAALSASPTGLIEPLSERELEVLALIAEGHSNREIGRRLFIALDTVKGHNRRIFGKLQVQRRTEAVARARLLGLL